MPQFAYKFKKSEQYMTAVELISNYIAAIARWDSQAMSSCRPADFLPDWVHGNSYYNEGLLGVAI